jgi:glucosamine--fructose-6-phosphate aminotransferase (isomerizing)
MHAGPEISVASTKAFTSQVVVLLLIGLYMARQRNMSLAEGSEYITALESLPGLIAELLTLEEAIITEAQRFADYPHIMVLGRGRSA